jgi:hypothetical protein
MGVRSPMAHATQSLTNDAGERPQNGPGRSPNQSLCSACSPTFTQQQRSIVALGEATSFPAVKQAYKFPEEMPACALKFMNYKNTHLNNVFNLLHLRGVLLHSRLHSTSPRTASQVNSLASAASLAADCTALTVLI